MSDKIRKYALPNLPYLFVFWFFSKIGTAYRIAPGADFGTKLMGMLDTFPKAFETYWPGLGGIDLLVGLAGAAGVYLLIQSKIRQAKKFRRDAEYGTARFGTKEDIKPFVDPKFQNNVILTGTEFLTMNTRPKIPANARNLNACVIGSSGSGKTRFWLTPQLLQAHSSYVVVDPKGGTLDQCGRFLQREKYRVRVFNSIDFSKSMHYNPLAYIKTESDVLKFVTALIANTKGDGKEGDEFWTKAETLLYCALVAYIAFEGPEEERNMNTLVEMINSMEVREDDETFKNAVDYMFDGLERRSPQHFAVRQYKKYKLASGVAYLSILMMGASRYDIEYSFSAIGVFLLFQCLCFLGYTAFLNLLSYLLRHRIIVTITAFFMLGVLYLYLTKISTALDMDYSLYKYWVVGLSHSLQINAFGEDLIPICLTLLAYLFLPTAISLSLFLRLDLRDLERR